jgi:hypothetical protein
MWDKQTPPFALFEPAENAIYEGLYEVRFTAYNEILTFSGSQT